MSSCRSSFLLLSSQNYERDDQRDRYRQLGAEAVPDGPGRRHPGPVEAVVHVGTRDDDPHQQPVRENA